MTLQTRALATTGRALAAPDWVDVATVTTARDGSYSFGDLRPTATADYRVVFAGNATHPPMVSPVKRVHVRAVVKLSRPDKRVERREKITLRGQLAPVHRGSAVVVKLDGPGRNVDKVKAKVDRRGTWKVTFRAPKVTGRWKVKAVWRGDVDHLGSTSKARTIRIVR